MDNDPYHSVRKIRSKHVISYTKDTSRILDIVNTFQRAGTNALAFGKHLYCHTLDSKLASNGGCFSRAVAKEMEMEFTCDASQIEEWIDVVSTDHRKPRLGPPYKPDRQIRMNALHAHYDHLSSLGCLPLEKIPCTNGSSAKGALADQLAVNYANNVHCHFDKYVHKFVSLSLKEETFIHHGLDPTDRRARLPQEAKKQLRIDVRKVVTDILTSAEEPSCREDLHAWVFEFQETMTPSPPSSPPGKYWRFYDQKTNPSRWLPFMVMINRWIENRKGITLSPLPQRTSFVPSHVRIDTTCLVDLLIQDASDMIRLKEMLEKTRMPRLPGDDVPPMYELPGLINGGKVTCSKGKMFDSLGSLLSSRLVSRFKQDEGFHSSEFKTAVWCCLTENKHASLTDHQGLVFNNIMDTDGVSVSLHYVQGSMKGVTRYSKGDPTKGIASGNSRLRAARKKERSCRPR
jgi:hypothetical protein